MNQRKRGDINMATRMRKFSEDSDFEIFSDQENYPKYNFCPFTGEELEEEEVPPTIEEQNENDENEEA